jgi:hypothetical protein
MPANEYLTNGGMGTVLDVKNQKMIRRVSSEDKALQDGLRIVKELSS